MTHMNDFAQNLIVTNTFELKSMNKTYMDEKLFLS